MRIKSYFCRTVEDAMAQASQELGPEAILVNSRRAPQESRHLGEYEVVFATEAPGEPPQEFSPVAAAGTPVSDRLSAEVADLKRELEGMRRTLLRTAIPPAPWMGASPDLPDAYATLVAADVPPELARDIVQSAERRVANGRENICVGVPQPDGWRRAVAEELESRVTVQPVLGRGDASPRVTALVGPPGSGKTTTLVKLAVNFGLASRRPVLLLSMDTYRVAAAEQLRSYAAILGVGFQVLETLAALAQALEEGRGKDLILIDTPGFGFGDMDAAGPLARFLSSREGIDTQLVLPASMKPGDLTRVAEAFEPFGPRRLLFTKIDETSSFGPLVAEAVRSSKPISFLATGQRIPEDLEAASRSRLAELVLAGEPAAIRTAA